MTASVSSIMDRLTRQAIDGELNRWGRWIERHADYTGHPSVNCLVAQLYGAGGGTPGHRILCLDMPDHIYATHGRVLRLPEAEKEAVYLFFAIRVKEDGTLWTVTERCRMAGIQEDSMRRRLARARYRILGVTVPEFLARKKLQPMSAVG
jgi:hypothetical protein